MNLSEKHCVPCEKGAASMARPEIDSRLTHLNGWSLDEPAKSISRLFSFDSYWAGVGFVNAVAWIAQQEKHHPDLALEYKKVRVSFSTHAVGGLSENDFISAAKVDALTR